MRNNIFINDQPFAVQVFNTSVYRLDSSFNVINRVSYADMAESLKTLAINLPEGSKTIAGITQKKASGEFVRFSNEPWVIIAGKWGKLNPNRPDFRPKADSKLFANWGDNREMPRHDLAGNERTGVAIGALDPAIR